MGHTRAFRFAQLSTLLGCAMLLTAASPATQNQGLELQPCRDVISSLKSLSNTEFSYITSSELTSIIQKFFEPIKHRGDLVQQWHDSLSAIEKAEHSSNPLNSRQPLNQLIKVLEEILQKAERTSSEEQTYFSIELFEQAQGLRDDPRIESHFQTHSRPQEAQWSKDIGELISEWIRTNQVGRLTKDSPILSLDQQEFLINQIRRAEKPLELIRVSQKVQYPQQRPAARDYLKSFTEWVNRFGVKETKFAQTSLEILQEQDGLVREIIHFFEEPSRALHPDVLASLEHRQFPFDPILEEATRFGLLVALESENSIVFKPRRKKDGQLFIAHPWFQLSLFFNEDKSLDWVWLRFENEERWRHFLPNDSAETPPRHHDQISHNGSSRTSHENHAPRPRPTIGESIEQEPSESERTPSRAVGVIAPVQITPGILTKDLEADIRKLNERYPGHHKFLQFIVEWIKEDREVRRNQARVRDKLVPLIEQVLAQDAADSFSVEAVQKELRRKVVDSMPSTTSSNGSTNGNHHRNADHRATHLNNLYQTYGPEITDYLDAEVTYLVRFERPNPHNATVNGVRFSKAVMERLKTSGNGERWIEILLKGFVSSREGQQGIKYIPKWSNHNPYEYEIKSMRHNFRIIGRLMEGNVLYFEEMDSH